jgi:superfamily II DNA/RNA helicase
VPLHLPAERTGRQSVAAAQKIEDALHRLTSHYGSKTGISQDARASTLANFVPATAGVLDEDGTTHSKDLYDVLFTTDVLSEGVNLQQAGHIISVDLPWNPMRLVQRHGRIDRIGSHHRFVDIDCFFLRRGPAKPTVRAGLGGPEGDPRDTRCGRGAHSGRVPSRRSTP